MKFKKYINFLLRKINLRIVNNINYEKNLFELNSLKKSCKLLRYLEISNKKNFLSNIKESKSELGQDLLVLNELNFKTNGFFVEFGATDGIKLSNTYLLEKKFSWKGILAEPAKYWHKDLTKNRSVFIEKNCVWLKSGETLNFNQVKKKESLSTIYPLNSNDKNKDARKKKNIYKVNTISLNDLLSKYNAPYLIDYLSIDTEGSEFDILSTLDFKKYKFRIITCEHNYSSNRGKINTLLSQNGYLRKYQELSQYDDFYFLGNNYD